MNLFTYLEQENITQSQLASLLGVSQGAVGQWKMDGRRIPADKCVAIERLSKGAVTCEEMRPDIYSSRLRSMLKKKKCD